MLDFNFALLIFAGKTLEENLRLTVQSEMAKSNKEIAEFLQLNIGKALYAHWRYTENFFKVVCIHHELNKDDEIVQRKLLNTCAHYMSEYLVGTTGHIPIKSFFNEADNSLPRQRYPLVLNIFKKVRRLN